MTTKSTDFIQSQTRALRPADLNRLIVDLPALRERYDAMIVSMVLRRHGHAFKRSSHAYKLRWPIPSFDVDHLLSVISPLWGELVLLFDDARPRLYTVQIERTSFANNL